MAVNRYRQIFKNYKCIQAYHYEFIQRRFVT